MRSGLVGAHLLAAGPVHERQQALRDDTREDEPSHPRNLDSDGVPLAEVVTPDGNVRGAGAGSMNHISAAGSTSSVYGQVWRETHAQPPGAYLPVQTGISRQLPLARLARRSGPSGRAWRGFRKRSSWPRFETKTMYGGLRSEGKAIVRLERRFVLGCLY